MTEYTLRVETVAVDGTVDIPSDARDVEIEYFSEEVQEAGIGGGIERREMARVKYLEKVGESVL